MIIYHDLRSQPLFKPYFEASGVPHTNHFRTWYTLLIHRFLVKIPAVLKKIPFEFLYNDPVCAPDDDKIIVFDTHASGRYLNWLCKNHPDKRIILWFWNPTKDMKRFLILKDRIECWSYCRADVHKYGMLYNTQFFFDCLAKEAEECPPPPVDRPPKALFIGRDKGRKKKLENLETQLNALGIVTDFRIIRPPRLSFLPSLSEKLIPYREVIDAVKGSTILIDLYTKPDAGVSLRAMEALFFRRKMITNRPLMRKEDFYNSHNIYILDHEERSLEEFLAEPYVDIDPAIRDSYLLSNWLKRFIKRRPKNDKVRQHRP